MISVPMRSSENRSKALTAAMPKLRGNFRIRMVDVVLGSAMVADGSELLATKGGGCESNDRSDSWRSDRRGIVWGCGAYADLDVLEPTYSNE
jgi:hypothetical protein